jgi:hypothetical protein
MEELKRKVEKLERVEIPIEREEASADGHRPNPNRGSMIPHIEIPDSEAAMPLTKTLERVLTGWRLLDADAAANTELQDGDFLVALQSATNSGDVPIVRYADAGSIANFINLGDTPITNVSGAGYRGPFEIHSSTSTSVVLWGSALSGAASGSFLYFKGVKFPLGSSPDPAPYNQLRTESSGLITIDQFLTHGKCVFLEWRSDTSGEPPFSGAFYLWQHTSFPDDDLDGASLFFPLWYFPADDNTLRARSEWERWIACPQVQGLA